MVTAIHEIVADGLCIFLASHVQRSGARAINISTRTTLHSGTVDSSRNVVQAHVLPAKALSPNLSTHLLNRYGLDFAGIHC